MDVGAGAEAAAARLDAEQVAEDGGQEVRVQEAPRVPDAQGDDAQPIEVGVPEDLDVRVLSPPVERTANRVLLAPVDLVDADGLLEGEDEPGADRLDDRRRASFLADRRLGVV